MAKEQTKQSQQTNAEVPPDTNEKDLGKVAVQLGLFKQESNYTATRQSLIDQVEGVLGKSTFGPLPLTGMAASAVDAVIKRLIKTQQMGNYATFKLLKFLSGVQSKEHVGGPLDEVPAVFKPTGEVVVTATDAFRECIRKESKGLKGHVSVMRSNGKVESTPWTNLIAPQTEGDVSAWAARFDADAKAASKKTA